MASPSRYQRVDTATSYDTAGFPQSLTFDGLDDGMSTGAVVLGSNMDCFIVINTTKAGPVLLSGSSGQYLGYAAVDGSNTVTGGAGVVSAPFVNGVQLAVASPASLLTAINNMGWTVVEFRSLNLSAWTTLNLASYNNSFRLQGGIAGVIICPAGDAAQRQKNRQYLGAKVGLTLP